MTKKHYEAIATILGNEAVKWNANSKHAFAIQGIADALADFFERENKLFQRDLFMSRISDIILRHIPN